MRSMQLGTTISRAIFARAEHDVYKTTSFRQRSPLPKNQIWQTWEAEQQVGAKNLARWREIRVKYRQSVQLSSHHRLCCLTGESLNSERNLLCFFDVAIHRRGCFRWCHYLSALMSDSINLTPLTLVSRQTKIPSAFYEGGWHRGERSRRKGLEEGGMVPVNAQQPSSSRGGLMQTQR